MIEGRDGKRYESIEIRQFFYLAEQSGLAHERQDLRQVLFSQIAFDRGLATEDAFSKSVSGACDDVCGAKEGVIFEKTIMFFFQRILQSELFGFSEYGGMYV